MNFPKLLSIPNPIKTLMPCSPIHLCLSRLSSQLSVIPNDNQKSSEELDKLYKTIEIEARSADRQVLQSYDTFVKLSANCLDLKISRSWEPFRYIHRRTLLRSAFVKKKYRVQYEFRTYFRNIEFKHLTASTADTFLEYIERNLPEGVALKVYKTAIEPLPQHLKQTNIERTSDNKNNI